MSDKAPLVRILLVLAFLLAWEWGASSRALDPYFFGQPSAIVVDLWHLVRSGLVFHHALVTLAEALGGFIIGSLFGVAAGFILAASPFLARVLDPILMVLYGIPRIALAPLFILWFGLGLTSKVVFAFVLVFFLLLFNTHAGLGSVSPEMVDAVRVMGASRAQLLRLVVFPAILPWIMAGLKSGIGMAFLGAVVGEYVGGNAGLGWMICSAGGLFQTTRVFSALIALAVLVVIMNSVFSAAEKRLLRWKPERTFV
ncbi:MAG: ABC transporter permease [Pseudomonadota bacterium]